MQFLAPLFLLGLGLIALPFWLHRLKTETPERESFASTMFLQASDDPIHVRRKLRYLVLMALRILFLLLLALAFSRPFWPSNDAVLDDDWSNLHLIVVDASASMANIDKQSRARQAVANILDEVSADEAAQLFSMDQSLQNQSEAVPNGTGVLAAFDDIQVSELALEYASMVRALEALMSAQDAANVNYQIHFVSDFQQSSMPSRFADLVAEPSADVNYQFFTHNIAAQEQGLPNLAIDQVEIVAQEARISIRAYAADSQDTGEVMPFTVRARLAGEQWRSTEAELSPSNSVTVAIDGFEFLPLQNQLEVELVVSDSLATDNHYYQVVNRSAPDPLLVLTDNPYGSSALYISALFADQTESTIGRNFVAQAQAISSFDARTLNRYSWVLIDDVGSINAALEEQLIGYVQEGGSIFIASGNNAESLTNLPIVSLAISQQTDIQQLASETGNFKSIVSVDQSHPILNQLAAWSDVRFENWLTLDNSDQSDVLMQLEDATPLLLEQQIGRGKVLLLTSSIDNQWNNLPVKPIFVALMRNVAQYLSGSELIQPAAYAGDTLNIQGNSLGAGQLIDPQGNAVLALGDRLQSGRLTMNTLGFYQASTAAGEHVIGVNLPPSESALETVPAESLQQWQELAQRDRSSAIVNAQGETSQAAAKRAAVFPRTTCR